MKSMSNVDIYTICQELKDLLTGARVDKSYQPTKDTIVIRFHKAGIGRLDLVMRAGKRIHCHAGDKRHRFDPWVGKIPCRRAWQPTPVFLSGESHGQRSLVGSSP